MDDNIVNYWNTISELAINYAGKMLSAIIVLFVGWWIINRFIRSVIRLMDKKDVDLSLRSFLISVIKYALRIMLVIAVAGMLGIEMTSFIAILGAAGLAIGLALQGSLSNFAGGIIILLLKPFKVGDFIETNNVSGTVREIRVFHTYLTTKNKQELIVPNGMLANATITNYSMYDIRGLTMTFNIGYEYEIDKVKSILNDVLLSKGDDLIKNPAHTIIVQELNNAYITYTVQAWFKTSSFWSIHHSLKETVIKKLAKENIISLHSQTINVKTID